MAGLFQVLYGKKDGTFAKAEELKGTDKEPLILPAKGQEELTQKICTRPFAIDWNGDGKLDLVVGNFAGTFYWFAGEGKGQFSPKASKIMAGDAPLKLPSAHSDPFVIDWDGDGDLDILSGASDGGVYLAINEAGKGEQPKMVQFKTLISPHIKTKQELIVRSQDLTSPTHASRIWVDDINNDGKLDLLVGDSVTLVSPAEGISEAEFQKRHDAWQKKFQAAMAEYSKVTRAIAEKGDNKANELRQKAAQAYQEVYQQRTSFMRQEMTGFVWLYLQK